MRSADWLRLAGAGLALWLAWRLAGNTELTRALADTHPGWLAAAVALTVPMHLLSAARWVFTCRRIAIHLPVGRAVADYYLASLLNMVLPGGVAGDISRTLRQARDGPPGPGRLRAPLHGVLLERGAGQAALLGVLLAGALIHGQPAALLPPGVAWTAAGLAAGAVLAYAARARLAAAMVFPLAAALRAFARDGRAAFLPWRVFWTQATLSLSVVACYLAIFACVALAVGPPLPMDTLLIAVPLVLTAMALPISVGGTGPRELTAAVLWPAFGLAAADGTAAALVYGLTVLLGSLPGAAVLLIRRRTGHPPG